MKSEAVELLRRQNSSDLYKRLSTIRQSGESELSEMSLEHHNFKIPSYLLRRRVLSSRDFKRLVKINSQATNSTELDAGDHTRYVDEGTMFQIAAKEISLPLNRQKLNLETEMASVKDLASIRHERIARFFSAYLDGSTVVLLSEYIPHGTLHQRICHQKLTTAQALAYFTQVIQGLNYLHDKDITHGSIQANTIQLTINDQIKLSDLITQRLSAKIVDKNEKNKDYRNQLLHTAPEIFSRPTEIKYHNYASDIWASGCVLVHMLTGAIPYDRETSNLSNNELYKKLFEGFNSKKYSSYNGRKLLSDYSPTMQNLVTDILQVDPLLRASSQKILRRYLTNRSAYETNGISRQLKTPLTLPNGNLLNAGKKKPEDKRVSLEIPHGSRKKRSTREPKEESLAFCCTFFCSRVLVFLFLMTKWILMVLAAALILASVSGIVFLSISIIYNLIQMSCQCELNEGFVVLIAIILLPILILLTTLCCNNACEKYRQSLEKDHLKSTKTFVPDPDFDVIVCGFQVMKATEKTQPKPTKKKTLDSDKTSPSNLAKGKMLNAIAGL